MDSPTVIVLLAITAFCGVSTVFCIVRAVIRNIGLRQRALQVGECLPAPTTPQWLLESRVVSTIHLPRVTFQCRVFRRERFRMKGRWREYRKEAIDWAQDVVNAKIGGVRVPEDTCAVSIPVAPFVCGSSPTEFHLDFGSLREGHFTYQMVGEERIQVIYYTENGVTCVAGYCIYIPRPYDSKYYYSRALLESYLDGPRYSRMAAPTTTTMNTFKSVQEVVDDLRLTFCPKYRKPVMIGMDGGVVKHFEWSAESNAFRMVQCEVCATTTPLIDDPPPAYSDL